MGVTSLDYRVKAQLRVGVANLRYRAKDQLHGANQRNGSARLSCIMFRWGGYKRCLGLEFALLLTSACALP